MNKCGVKNCVRKYHAKGYCNTHYRRKLQNRELNIPIFATRKAKIRGNIALIRTSKSGELIIIDKDMAHIDKYNWWYDGGYARARVNGEIVKLHHYIIGKPPSGKVTDHINRNPLDNRRVNLRHVERRVNSINAKVSKHNTSGHRGVSWNSSRKRWVVRINHENKRIGLGFYADLEKAIEARKSAESKYGYSLIINGEHV